MQALAGAAAKAHLGDDLLAAQQSDVFEQQAHHALAFALGHLRVSPEAREVAGQGEDVLDARLAVAGEDVDQLLAGVVDAGEVGHRRQRRVPLDVQHDVAGAFTGAAPGAVGHRHERGLERREVGDGLENRPVLEPVKTDEGFDTLNILSGQAAEIKSLLSEISALSENNTQQEDETEPHDDDELNIELSEMQYNIGEEKVEKEDLLIVLE